MGGRVIVVGSVNADLVVSIGHLPGPGETVTGGTFARHEGGKGGNQAVASARLGVPTALVGAVGGDAFGSEARTALEAAGVDVTELLTLPDQATGVALIVVAAGGENLIAVASGANAALDIIAVRAAFTRLAPTPRDVVLVCHEVPTTAVREALRLARDAGATTVLNPAPANGLDRSVFEFADVLTPNRGELAALAAADGSGLPRQRAEIDDLTGVARTLVNPNAEGPSAGAVLVSLGSAGAMLVRADAETVEIPAPRVRAVDATGAGDALNGVVAASLASGMNLEAGARRAVAFASRSTERAGARDGLPISETVLSNSRGPLAPILE